MRIAVMGAGAIGSYYGALLQKSGEDVTFISRGEHYREMKKNRLKIKSKFEDFELRDIKVTDDPSSIGKVDLIIFSVKLYDGQEAAKAIKSLIGENTVILPLQNPDMSKEIEAIVGQKIVFGGTTFIYVAKESPNTINQTSDFQKIVFGELTGKITPRAENVKKALEKAGVTVVLTDDIQKELWSKQIFIAPMFGVGSIVQMQTGDFRDIPETREVLVDAMKEIESLAKAQGVNLDKNVVKEKLEFIDNLNPEATTSMQRDVAAGKKSEGEEIFSRLIQIGQEENVATPTLSFIYAMLKPRELKVRQ